MQIHVVKSGETLSSIAQNYGLSVQYLQNINQLPNPNDLVVGQTILIIYPEISHTVVQGDTLTSIANQYGVTTIRLLRNNPFTTQRQIVPGDTIVISYATPLVGSAKISGYVYPNVNLDYLRTVLPYLTYIAIFTYGINDDGTLITIDDEEIIALSRDFGVAPLMHLSSLSKDGTFSSELASKVLNDIELQETLIEDILSTIKEKNYSGLDIDFEFLPAEDSQNYVNFVSKLTSRLNQYGYIVIAALAPKTSADQKGLLYEGHDYFGIGAAANLSFIMTYEWGYTFGPPMAVAPINNVKKVLDYAVTEIPTDQILMGIPSYGYIWTLPYEKGVTKATSISNLTAIEIAADRNVEIFYDETAQSPFYNFIDTNGTPAEVWFEDARSVEAKLMLIKEYNLVGAGYWNLDRPFQQNWMVLNSLYNILQVPLV
ncbi:MAG: glycosyl hydrolase family 18 protein [Lachnospiraceae bacterium]|nr:glycosyl hydrolase family 18 protein [Lachnospiraceae bacterium]